MTHTTEDWQMYSMKTYQLKINNVITLLNKLFFNTLTNFKCALQDG